MENKIQCRSLYDNICVDSVKCIYACNCFIMESKITYKVNLTKLKIRPRHILGCIAYLFLFYGSQKIRFRYQKK